jgi:hypothetical protein
LSNKTNRTNPAKGLTNNEVLVALQVHLGQTIVVASVAQGVIAKYPGLIQPPDYAVIARETADLTEAIMTEVGRRIRLGGPDGPMMQNTP